MSAGDQSTRVLIVAHRTAATQPLLDAVRERARRGPCTFTLLVPNAAHGLEKLANPDEHDEADAQRTIEQAIPRLSEAAGSPVEGIVGTADPSAAVQDAINTRGFDEVIISTLSPKISRWLRLDLPHKVAGLGLPVTTVTASDRAGSAEQTAANAA